MARPILVFDLSGRNAHFRDISTNSSAMSYFAPPRPTIVGLLECLLGFEKPSGLFQPDRCDIAVGIETPLRKLMMTQKYLKIQNGEILSGGAIVPFQIVRNVNSANLVYRVYLRHEDEGLLEEIEYYVRNKYMTFPLYLGSAGLGCQTLYVGKTEDYEESMQGNVLFKTVIPKDIIGEIEFVKDAGEKRRYVKEKKPRVLDSKRNLVEVREYLVPINENGILLKSVTYPYITARINGEERNIAWL